MINGGLDWSSYLFTTYRTYLQITTTESLSYTFKRSVPTPHIVFLVFTSRCLAAASNVGFAPSYVFPKCAWPHLPASHLSQLQLSTGSVKTKTKWSFRYDLRWVGQPVLVSSTHLCPKSRILLLSDICKFVEMRRRSLWRENESVVYNCCWTSPVQSFLGPSPAGLMTIFYCLRFETPSTWRTRFPSAFISFTRNRVAQLYPHALGSFFFASYDSQGYGGGIRTRLNAGD
jgi:hypothetical protein